MKTILAAPPATAARIQAADRQRSGWPTPDALALTLLGFVVTVFATIALLAVIGVA